MSRALDRSGWMPEDWLRAAGPGLAIALGGVAVGVGLAVLSEPFGRFGPGVLLAIVLAPLAVALLFFDPRFAPALVAASFPVGSVVIPRLPVALQVVELTALVVTGIVVLRRLALGRAPLAWHPALWWAVALLLWTFVALPSAIDVELALKQIALLAGALTFVCVVVGCIETPEDCRVVLGGVLAACMVVAATALTSTGQFQASLGGTTVEGRLQGAFDQPNQLGSFSALFLMVALGLALGARSRRGRWLGIAAAAALTATLILSLSRGAWIGAALGFVYLLVVLPEARRLLLAALAPLAIAALVFGPALPTTPQIEVIGERLEAITTPSPYDDRPAIWGEAVREVEADPYTGQGPGSFPVASLRSSSEASTVLADHAHNIFLTWGAESGLPAVALLVGLFIAIAAAAHKGALAALAHDRRLDRVLIAALAASLLTVVGHGLVDFTWRNAVVFLSMSIVLGSLLGMCRAVSSPHR